MDNNKPEIKLTLEQHRAILYKFLSVLVADDKLGVKGFSIVVNVCKAVDALINKAVNDGCVADLIASACEDEDVKQLMEIVDKEHEEVRNRRKEALKKKANAINKLHRLMEELVKD